MFDVLRNRAYAHLFCAQVVALLGTGLLTVALGLIAWEIAGENAGQVLGFALTIKMVAYVFAGPVIQALVAYAPRRAVLVAADIFRALIALALPFVTEVWQIYTLIFLLQAASATFTPVFQAVVPALFEDEDQYTRALSLSRLAYDLESLLSPALAAALLAIMSFSMLFLGTTTGFALSALLVMTARLPGVKPVPHQNFRERLLRGSRIYLATPRLRGLLALNMAVSAAGALVIVNTVVIVRGVYGLEEGDLAVALGAVGAGSLTAAMLLPTLLDRFADRQVMTLGAFALGLLMLATGLFCRTFGWPEWPAFLIVWGCTGFCQAAIMVPSGRLLRRSSHDADRPALFAAQFALSHACWLLAYPLAGVVGARAGVDVAMIVLGALSGLSAFVAVALWPAGAERAPQHLHSDLPADHPHLKGARKTRRGWVHRHAFVIDDEHHVWPTNG